MRDQIAELRAELLEGRAAVLDARLDIYSVNFGEASRHFEAARTSLRAANARLLSLPPAGGCQIARGRVRADILSWSRSQGLFAGRALEGATLREDLDDNATLYGKKLENRDIVTKGVRAPKAAAKLMALLNRYSAKERTN